MSRLLHCHLKMYTKMLVETNKDCSETIPPRAVDCGAFALERGTLDSKSSAVAVAKLVVFRHCRRGDPDTAWPTSCKCHKQQGFGCLLKWTLEAQVSEQWKSHSWNKQRLQRNDSTKGCRLRSFCSRMDSKSSAVAVAKLVVFRHCRRGDPDTAWPTSCKYHEQQGFGCLLKWTLEAQVSEQWKSHSWNKQRLQRNDSTKGCRLRSFCSRMDSKSSAVAVAKLVVFRHCRRGDPDTAWPTSCKYHEQQGFGCLLKWTLEAQVSEQWKSHSWNKQRLQRNDSTKGCRLRSFCSRMDSKSSAVAVAKLVVFRHCRRGGPDTAWPTSCKYREQQGFGCLLKWTLEAQVSEQWKSHSWNKQRLQRNDSTKGCRLRSFCSRMDSKSSAVAVAKLVVFRHCRRGDPDTAWPTSCKCHKQQGFGCLLKWTLQAQVSEQWKSHLLKAMRRLEDLTDSYIDSWVSICLNCLRPYSNRWACSFHWLAPAQCHWMQLDYLFFVP